MQIKFALGGLVIVAGLAYLLVAGVEQTAATHMTLDVLVGEEITDGQRIQLGGGTVVEGSIAWDQYRHRPEFLVTNGEHTIKVKYKGSAVLPDTFQDKAQVVLEGRYLADQGLFEAQVIFAKCPSKYEGQSYEGHTEAKKSM